MENRKTLLDAALEYHRRGWSIFPVNGKVPVLSEWTPLRKKPASEDQIREWFKNRKLTITGIAVIEGAASGGLCIRDFDNPAAYERWKQKYPDLARTLPTAKTGKGWHVYFRVEHEIHVIGDDKEGELRGSSNFYHVLPPSRHLNGGYYQWVNPLGDGLPVIDPHACGLVPVKSTVAEICESEPPRLSLTTSEPSEYSDPSDSSKSSDISKTSDPSKHSEQSDVIPYTVEEVIAMTLPTKEGQRNTCILRFARGIRYNCKLADAGSEILREIFKQWHKRALPHINTKDFMTSYGKFISDLRTARLPLGKNPWVKAFADASTPTNNAALEEFIAEYGEKSQILVRACWLMASTHPQKRFFISGYKVEAYLGVPQRTVSSWFNAMVFDGVLKLEERGNYAMRRSNRYIWIGPTVNTNTTPAIAS